MFKINDYVFITPTGDKAIDAFLDQQMVVVDIVPVNDCGYKYTQYLLANTNGDLILVNDNECIEKGVRLNGE